MGDSPLERTAVRRALTLLVGMLSCSGFAGQSESMTEGQTVIIVVGAAGTPEYAAQFTKWAGAWEQACTKSHAEFISIGLTESDSQLDRAPPRNTCQAI